ncbi:uncharacterized protein B4U79_05501, partial [Dinothrombium tinctorium]
IANEEGFDYEVFLNPENSNKKLEVIGTWNGLMRDLVNDKAYKAISDLPITNERSEAVDFTMPFMKLGD